METRPLVRSIGGAVCIKEVMELFNLHFLQANINLELEKLRIELRHVKGMYAMAQSETIDASRKVGILILVDSSKYFLFLYLPIQFSFCNS